MQKVLQSLLELQSADRRLSDVRARLAVFPKKLAEVDARVTAAKAELETSKAAQLATIKDRKRYELDVEQWKERVRKYRDQTSQVRTNEAYKVLQHEVQMAETEIAKAEDRLLEQMVAGEEYDRRVKAAEKALKETEETARAAKAKIESEKAAAEKDFADLSAERARFVADIPEDLVNQYEHIAKKHGGIALAEVQDEKCTACGMRVRPHVFQEMCRSTSGDLFQCETCTRFLYYIEPETFVRPVTGNATQETGPASSSRDC